MQRSIVGSALRRRRVFAAPSNLCIARRLVASAAATFDQANASAIGELPSVRNFPASKRKTTSLSVRPPPLGTSIRDDGMMIQTPSSAEIAKRISEEGGLILHKPLELPPKDFPEQFMFPLRGANRTHRIDQDAAFEKQKEELIKEVDLLHPMEESTAYFNPILHDKLKELADLCCAADDLTGEREARERLDAMEPNESQMNKYLLMDMLMNSFALGSLAHLFNDGPKMLHYFFKASELARGAFGDSHPAYWRANVMLGYALALQNRYPEAHGVLLNCVNFFQMASGLEVHDDSETGLKVAKGREVKEELVVWLGYSLIVQAAVYDLYDDPGREAEASKRAVQVVNSKYFNDKHMSMEALNRLAMAYKNQKRTKDAVMVRQQVFEDLVDMKELNPHESLALTRLQGQIIELERGLAGDDKIDDAIARAKQHYTILKKRFGETDPRTYTAGYRAAYLEFQEQRWEDALKTYEQLEKDMPDSQFATDSLSVDPMTGFNDQAVWITNVTRLLFHGNTLLALKRTDEAIALYARARALAEKFDFAHPVTPTAIIQHVVAQEMGELFWVDRRQVAAELEKIENDMARRWPDHPFMAGTLHSEARRQRQLYEKDLFWWQKRFSKKAIIIIAMSVMTAYIIRDMMVDTE